MSLLRNIDHINLTVADFRESARWYEQAFGFVVVEEAVTDGVLWGILRAGDSMLCLYEAPDFTLLDRHQLAERKLHGLAHFGLRISDPEKWQRIAREMGIEILYGGTYRWPHSDSWYIKDPTGYEIEVVHWDKEQISFDPL